MPILLWFIFFLSYQIENTNKIKCIKSTNHLSLILIYRDSLVSAVFWSPANRTIAKTALIEHWFSTKIAIWDFWAFKVHFFANFQYISFFESEKLIDRIILTWLLSYLWSIFASLHNVSKTWMTKYLVRKSKLGALVFMHLP